MGSGRGGVESFALPRVFQLGRAVRVEGAGIALSGMDCCADVRPARARFPEAIDIVRIDIVCIAVAPERFAKLDKALGAGFLHGAFDVMHQGS